MPLSTPRPARAAVVAAALGVLAAATGASAHGGGPPPPILDGKRLKRFTWKASGNIQANVRSNGLDPAECPESECERQVFYVRPATGVRGNVVFTVSSLRPAHLDLYVLDDRDRVVAACAGPVSKNEVVVVPATSFKRMAKYTMLVHFNASINDAFEATIEFPRSFRSELPQSGGQRGSTCAYDDL